MAASVAPRIGSGCRFLADYGQTGTFAELANVQSITPAAPKVGDVEWTPLTLTSAQSSSGSLHAYVKQFIPGFIEYEDLKVVWEYNAADYSAALTSALARQMSNFQVVFVDTGEYVQFTGFIHDGPKVADVKKEELMTLELDIKITDVGTYHSSGGA